jgi:hypothetical protein
MDGELETCSICLQDYEGIGNSASPYLGICCDECNSQVVMPVRRLMTELADERLMAFAAAE